MIYKKNLSKFSEFLGKEDYFYKFGKENEAEVNFLIG
jgi:hypothetical protein